MTDSLKKYAAALLCGGRSRRMGRDKALALRDRQGRPLLAALAEELAGRFGEVVLIADRRSKLEALPELARFTALEDLHPGAGPAGAIDTALQGRPGQTIFVMACDMPVINWAVIEKTRLCLENRRADVAMPRRGDVREPLCAFYGPEAGPAFQAALAAGRRAVLDCCDGLKVVHPDLSQEDLASGFGLNLNTPADLRAAGLPPAAGGTNPGED
ncbi:MAG: molybdenum cofactor guanylyltransferase [Candidatus Adiutrix sp.]|jgi:molybdopterin-guanine dinucleotide biosynthesis protein A|nr:molybdenum cofactor guanylyltransferase [Candidatus Adiutrix sp.]